MKKRSSGILLHITSLPSRYGIGDLGPESYQFANFLAETHQGCWQILPLNPTSVTLGDSPYSSYSAFGGNPLFISPDILKEEGFITPSDLSNLKASTSGPRIDYPTVSTFKKQLLQKAYQRYRSRLHRDYDFQSFCHNQEEWLGTHALFVALDHHFKKASWSDWPPSVRDQKAKALKDWRNQLKEPILTEKFIQYLFFKQWTALKSYCNGKNIQVIGDLPIYVHYHSADVWANPEIFKLDPKKRRLTVAGIPPDYFSATGQLWGNPIYRWDILKERGYDWWVRRVAYNFKLFDTVRLDHFMGFVHFWEVPAHHKTAVKGQWTKGPGEDFFNTLLRHFPFLPFIAEDLGVITTEVRQLRDQFDLPGMRVLQFAFGNDPLADLYKPHNFIKNCVAYTGTHDNDTLIGWILGDQGHSTRKPSEVRQERDNALRYLGYRKAPGKDLHWEFIRLLMMSSADTVIIPMQDLLGLGEDARMNRPAIAEGNWEWRLLPRQLSSSLKGRLAEMTPLFGRV